MNLSWMMSDLLRHNVELGLAPELGGAVGVELELMKFSELEALAKWLDGRAFAGPDRENVKAELAARQSSTWRTFYSHPAERKIWLDRGYSEDVVDLTGELMDYANARYTENGWDILVECWSVEDVSELIQSEEFEPDWGDIPATLAKLVPLAEEIVSLVDERRREVQSYADY